jgi:hypothetical protein
MGSLSSIIGLVASVCAIAAHARADRQEWHLSPIGIIGASAPVEGGRRSWGFAGGAGFRAAYGIKDFFELGVHAGFSTTQQLTFKDAMIQGQPGNLVANQYAIEFALDARLIGDVHLSSALARFHPLIGIRGGGLVRILTSQLLVDDQKLLIMRPDNAASILPCLTGYVGAEYRFARTWLAGVTGSFTYAGTSYYAAAASLQISWMTYFAP